MKKESANPDEWLLWVLIKCEIQFFC